MECCVDFRLDALCIITAFVSKKDKHGNVSSWVYKLVHTYKLGLMLSTQTQALFAIISNARMNMFIHTLELMECNKQEVNLSLVSGTYSMKPKTVNKRMTVHCVIAYRLGTKAANNHNFLI